VSEDDGEPVAEQYFAERPRSASVKRELKFLYRGELIAFRVDAGVFASHGLDPGTALLIENLALRPTDRVLDLGCGWGPSASSPPRRPGTATSRLRKSTGAPRALPATTLPGTGCATPRSGSDGCSGPWRENRST